MNIENISYFQKFVNKNLYAWLKLLGGIFK